MGQVARACPLHPRGPQLPCTRPLQPLCHMLPLATFCSGTDGSSPPWVHWRCSAAQSSLLALKAGRVPHQTLSWLCLAEPPRGCARPSTSARSCPFTTAELPLLGFLEKFLQRALLGASGSLLTHPLPLPRRPTCQYPAPRLHQCTPSSQSLLGHSEEIDLDRMAESAIFPGQASSTPPPLLIPFFWRAHPPPTTHPHHHPAFDKTT